MEKELSKMSKNCREFVGFSVSISSPVCYMGLAVLSHVATLPPTFAQSAPSSEWPVTQGSDLPREITDYYDYYCHLSYHIQSYMSRN